MNETEFNPTIKLLTKIVLFASWSFKPISRLVRVGSERGNQSVELYIY